MSFQKCPKCNATGRANNFDSTLTRLSTICDVCDGKKIISILTGLPPKESEQNKCVTENVHDICKQMLEKGIEVGGFSFSISKVEVYTDYEKNGMHRTISAKNIEPLFNSTTTSKLNTALTYTNHNESKY